METSIFLGNRQEYFEYELLSLSGGEYVHSGYIDDYVIDGSIKIDFTRDIITNASFTMKNVDTIDYLSDVIKPWYCIVVSGVTYKFPLGVYMLTIPEAQSDGKVITVKISGNDLLLALEQDKLVTSYSLQSGSSVVDAIETLLDGVGTWVNYNIEPSDETLSEDMSYELGKSKLFVINSLLKTINYYPLWADGNGYYRSAPWSEYKNTTWNFYDNTQSLYVNGVGYNLDYSDMYNKVIIISNELEADTEPITSTLTFEDIDMADYPLSYTSIGRYITKIFKSETVSQDYADLRARRELLKMLEIQESIDYKHAFVTSRDDDGLPNQGDCFAFKNTLLGVNSTYLIESQDYKLKVGSLVNSTIRRIVSV